MGKTDQIASEKAKSETAKSKKIRIIHKKEFYSRYQCYSA